MSIYNNKYYALFSKWVLIVFSTGIVLHIIRGLLPVNLQFLDPFESEKIWSFSFMLTSIFVGPLLETILFQVLIFLGFDNLRWKHNWVFAIGISAVLFGLTHSYDPIYRIETTFFGIALAWAFHDIRSKKNDIYAFWIVTVIHCLWNLFVSIMRSI